MSNSLNRKKLKILRKLNFSQLNFVDKFSSLSSFKFKKYYIFTKIKYSSFFKLLFFWFIVFYDFLFILFFNLKFFIWMNFFIHSFVFFKFNHFFINVYDFSFKSELYWSVRSVYIPPYISFFYNGFLFLRKVYVSITRPLFYRIRFKIRVRKAYFKYIRPKKFFFLNYMKK